MSVMRRFGKVGVSIKFPKTDALEVVMRETPFGVVPTVWLPIQLMVIYGTLWIVTRTGHLAGWEQFGVFFGVGVLTGSVGIVYAHELLHQTNRAERWLADLLLASVLYSHFRSDHLLVHHPWV